VDVDFLIASRLRMKIILFDESSSVSIMKDELVNLLSVAQNPTEEHVVISYEIALMHRATFYYRRNFIDETRVYFLVGIYPENPIVPEGQVLQAPLLLFGVLSVPPKFSYLGS